MWNCFSGSFGKIVPLIFFLRLDASFNQETAWLQSSVSRSAMQDGANCDPPTLLLSEICFARVWATRLQTLLAYTREQSTKEILSSLISLMIGEMQDLWLSHISQSFNNSWLSVSTCSWRTFNSPARIMPSLHASASIDKAFNPCWCQRALPPL